MTVGRKLRFSAASLLDIHQAENYYKSARAGLETEFRTELSATIDAIASNPNAFQIIYKDARRACVTKFPYGVFYREKNNLIRIVAVINHRRDPHTWQRRV